MDLAIYVGLFVAATTFLALEPGPGFVKLAADTLRHGRAAGALVAIGMALGAIPYVVMVAFGINALIAALPGALSLLKVAGLAYLAWQAVCLLTNKPGDGLDPTRPDRDRVKPDRLSGHLLSGLLLVLLNPRTPVLYAAYLPIFLRKDALVGTDMQLVLLGLCVAAVFLLVDLLFVGLTFRVGGRLRDNRALQRAIRYLGASLLVVFGARLLLRWD